MKVHLLRELTWADLGTLPPGIHDLPDMLAKGLIEQGIAEAISTADMAAPSTAAHTAAPRTKRRKSE